jgi:hypothetical protein
VQLLQTKLGNKVEVLLAVSQDLAKCQTDRDQMRDECEFLKARVADAEATLQQRQNVTAADACTQISICTQDYDRQLADRAVQQAQLSSMLEKSDRDYKRALHDNMQLQQQLQEAAGDVRALRVQRAHRMQNPSEHADTFDDDHHREWAKCARARTLTQHQLTIWRRSLRCHGRTP